MSLVFYDTETTGIEKFFDQILQFAAIRTNEELKEVDTFAVRCRLLPHIVPAPDAMRVTGVTASQLTDVACPSHYEMVRRVEARLTSWSPALFLGWNSIKFDEELLRQAFYKTLHNPYLTNTANNTRTDALRIVQACDLFAPDALVISTDETGRKIYKLDKVAPANGFAHDDAHDALGDARATLFLCRLVYERAQHVWSAFMRFSKKSSVVDYITEEPAFCLSYNYGGRSYSHIVTVIGTNPENSNEYYVFDLSIQPESVRSLSQVELLEFVVRLPRPVRTLKSNAAPILFGVDEAPECCQGRHLGNDEISRRAGILRADTALCDRLIAAVISQQQVYPPSSHVEHQIYEGFTQDPDKKLMSAFHQAPWPNRPAIVEKFQDLRLRHIGRQLIHCEKPELLNEKLRQELDVARAKRVLGHCVGAAPWKTLPIALQELQAMLQVPGANGMDHLRDHEAFLLSRLAEANSRLSKV
jgi:exodeoxyribonuclease-1